VAIGHLLQPAEERDKRQPCMDVVVMFLSLLKNTTRDNHNGELPFIATLP
jgi:hypothetical protein